MPAVRRRLRCWILLLACVAAAGPVAARAPAQAVPGSAEHDVTVWSIADGLPQSSVNGIVQAHNGELWLATFGGLSSFDGAHFRNFDLDTSPELPSHRLTALAIDAGGELWAATQNTGLIRMRDGRVVEAVEAPVPGGEILSLAIDPAGRRWVHTSAGQVFVNGGGTWSPPVAGLGLGRYGSLAPAEDGSMWVASQTTLARVDAAGTIHERVPAPSTVNCATRDATGNYWLGLGTGLGRLRDGAIEALAIEPPFDAPVVAVLPIDEDRIWVGTLAGPELVERLDPDGPYLRRGAPPGLPPKFGVRWMLRDREQNVWIGSIDQGLARVSPHRLHTFTLQPTAAPAVALAGDLDGTCWIAFGCGGLGRVRDGGQSVELSALPKVDGQTPCAYSLLADSRGRLWIGSQGLVLRGAEAPYRELDLELATSRVADMLEDSTGVTWIATNDGTLRCLDGEDRVATTLKVEGGIDVLAAGADGSVWIGGSGRVSRLQAGRLDVYGPEQGMPRAGVRDLLCDEDGSVWIASYGGGLARWSEGRLASITTAQGLPNASLTRILEDDQGRFWIMSNAGLIVAPKDELCAVLDGSLPSIDPVLLGPESGVSEANHGAPAGFKDRNGALVFGTIRGAVRVDPREFPFNRVPPETRIERVTCDARTLAVDARPSVPPGTRRLRFDFTAFALAVPRRVHFRYRLEGFDPSWIDVGPARAAEYSALAPGEYVFEVVARNEHGVWSTTPARLEFDVLPTWWQRRSVQAAALAAVLCGLFSWHRLRVAAVHRRGELLLAATEGRRSAEAREWQLREQLSHIGRVATAGELATSLAHEVNQPLAAIVANTSAARRLLQRAQPDRAELEEILREIAAQGERASEVIRRLRDFVRKHEAERRDVSIAELLRATLPMVRRELEDGAVQVDLEIAQGLPRVSADPIQLQQVLVNLIHNACDALASVDRPRRLVIAAAATPGHVAIRVRDNGPGLAPEVAGRLFEPYVTTKSSGMGLGLPICRTIVEGHGGRLAAAPAPGGGVEFTVELPAAPQS